MTAEALAVRPVPPLPTKSDGQGAFNYGAAASVGAAVEVHRPGGDAKVAGVGFRRKVDVHYCFRRNFLIDAL